MKRPARSKPKFKWVKAVGFLREAASEYDDQRYARRIEKAVDVLVDELEAWQTICLTALTEMRKTTAINLAGTNKMIKLVSQRTKGRTRK